MDNITETQRELLERVMFEMSSNAEIIEYNLERLGVMDEIFLDNLRSRLVGIVNAIDDSQHQYLDIAL